MFLCNMIYTLVKNCLILNEIQARAVPKLKSHAHSGTPFNSFLGTVLFIVCCIKNGLKQN